MKSRFWAKSDFFDARLKAFCVPFGLLSMYRRFFERLRKKNSMTVKSIDWSQKALPWPSDT
jgi:hypothetical protein